ncbi:hypothetical protein [Leptospira harrisiae]|uniref:hypothetical protein n=1 Tax=Leptospira harrisiae TaxID=2023189 RepID=UPI000C2A8C5D|nr:hypothetical protein [Leptospira harrisiae]PKA09306.1 hypothetical protein CH366_06250 [Leptospira harrisiae]
MIYRLILSLSLGIKEGLRTFRIVMNKESRRECTVATIAIHFENREPNKPEIWNMNVKEISDWICDLAINQPQIVRFKYLQILDVRNVNLTSRPPRINYDTKFLTEIEEILDRNLP